MLTSIHPLGERGRGQSWLTTVIAMVIGSTVGGASVGLLAGAVGSLAFTGSGRVIRVAAALGLLAAAALDAIGQRIPGPRRQVNENWLHSYRGWVYGFGFGSQLGAGLLTIITSAAVYAVVLLALLNGSTAAGGSIGATFGLARALPVLAAARVEDPFRLARLHRRLVEAHSSARWGTVCILAALSALVTVAV